MLSPQALSASSKSALACHPLYLCLCISASLPADGGVHAAQSDKLMVHTPDCASLHKAKPIPWAEKRFNATLVGSTSPDLYPLRATMEQALQAGLIPGGEKLPHPGFASPCWLQTVFQPPSCTEPCRCTSLS